MGIFDGTFWSDVMGNSAASRIWSTPVYIAGLEGEQMNTGHKAVHEMGSGWLWLWLYQSVRRCHQARCCRRCHYHQPPQVPRHRQQRRGHRDSAGWDQRRRTP